MTVKSIVEVDVRDEAFKAFAAMFEKYRDNLKTLPGAWGQQGAELDKNADKMAKQNAELTKQNAQLKKNAADEAAAERAAEKAAKERSKSWESIGKQTSLTAKNIRDMTLSLGKMALFTGVFSLLGSGAGLFGVNRLAATVSASNAGARGIGASTGEVNAFNVNYSRYIPDTGSYLSNVNDALHDYSKRGAFLQAGLTENDLRGKSTAEVAAALIPHLKESFERGGKSTQGMAAYGLDKFASLQDLNRLSGYSKADLSASGDQYQKDVKTFTQDPGTLRSWTDFKTQLDRAGQTIENVFVKGLTPLIGPFTELSKSVATALGTLLADPHMGDYVKSLSENIQDFAKYLASDKFKDSANRFFTVIDVLGTKLYELLQKLGWVSNTGAPGTSTGSGGSAGARTPVTLSDTQKDALRSLGFRAPKTTMRLRDYADAPWDESLRKTAEESLKESLNGPAGRAVGELIAQGHMSPADIYKQYQATQRSANFSGKFSALENKYGLPNGLLSNVYQAESGGGKNLLSAKGAAGPFGFMPNTAKEYGLTDPNNTMDAADAAARKLRDLYQQYGSQSWDKPIAAYNWGSGSASHPRLDAAVAKYGDSWRDHVPAETQGYLKQVYDPLRANGGNVAGGAAVRIDIFNNTGGSAIVSASQIAH